MDLDDYSEQRDGKSLLANRQVSIIDDHEDISQTHPRMTEAFEQSRISTLSAQYTQCHGRTLLKGITSLCSTTKTPHYTVVTSIHLTAQSSELPPFFPGAAKLCKAYQYTMTIISDCNNYCVAPIDHSVESVEIVH
jgi:hypothetical protein